MFVNLNAGYICGTVRLHIWGKNMWLDATIATHAIPLSIVASKQLLPTAV
jgi:hypothetical protein